MPEFALQSLRQACAASQAAGGRLRALVHGGTQRCEQLIAALERLPGCATADPWALPVAAEAAPQAGSPRRRARGSAALAAAPAAGSARPRLLASVPSPRVGEHGLRAGGTGSMRQAPLGEARTAPAGEPPASGDVQRAAPAAVPRRSDAAQAARSALSRLMAAHPPSFDELLAERTRVAGPRLREVAGALAAGRMRRGDAGPRASAPEGRVQAALRDAAPAEIAAALARWAPPVDLSPAGAPPYQPVARLLRELLGGVSPVAAQQRPQGELPPLAPRAPSRLLGPPAPAPASAANEPRASAPEAPAAEFTADEATAQALNRLLIDQAWLRGVDLT